MIEFSRETDPSKALPVAINANHSAIVAVYFVAPESAVAVKLVFALKRQAIPATALESKRAVVAVDEEVYATWVVIAVTDLGEAATDVGRAIRPGACVSSSAWPVASAQLSGGMGHEIPTMLPG